MPSKRSVHPLHAPYFDESCATRGESVRLPYADMVQHQSAGSSAAASLRSVPSTRMVGVAQTACDPIRLIRFSTLNLPWILCSTPASAAFTHLIQTHIAQTIVQRLHAAILRGFGVRTF